MPGGSPFATGKVGTHSFTVTATSLDGGVASNTVFYSVAPDNRFTVSKPRARADGSIQLTVAVPGPGRVAVLECSPGGRFVFGRGNASARRAGKLHLTTRPTARGRQTLRGGRRLRVSVTVSYRPKGGTQRAVRLSVAA